MPQQMPLSSRGEMLKSGGHVVSRCVRWRQRELYLDARGQQRIMAYLNPLHHAITRSRSSRRYGRCRLSASH